MCGIVAILNDDAARPADPYLLRRMSDAIAHRGPDAEGFHLDGPAGLANRRLAIIDLDTGNQPISDEDGRIWVVFNGEIYNHPDLQKELAQRGHRLRTRSDTETIVHLYQEHGDDLVHHLRGMFAFALWDSTRRRLLLARDRLGKKPLVYARAGGAFIAASEIKALLPHPGLDTSIDLTALDAFLTYQSVPAPLTIYRGVRKLPPAHLMVVEDGRVEIRRYWRVPTREPLRIDETECEREILRLLREAVRLRLVSEVPLGAFLSGGIDSSLIVALMQEASSRPVKTYSIGFEEKEFSELEHAKAVARHLGTDHHEFIVRPDAAALLPRLARAYDEPFADHSSVPTFHVARETRRHVTVALNGDGGDEAFGGYLRYRFAELQHRLDRIPARVRRALGAATALAGPLEARLRLLRRAGGFLRRSALEPAERYAAYLTYFQDEHKRLVYSPELAAAVDGTDPLAKARDAFDEPAPEFLDRMLATDLETYLPDTLMVKMDIASMANSLETRSPLLDHVLVEFAARVPARFKLRSGITKYILRRVAGSFLPAEILERPKQGFGLPVQGWMRDELRPLLEEMVLGQRALARGYFRPEGLRRLVADHAAGRADHGVRLWALLVLEVWHRACLERETF
jgi:asparagine synthase (glutamine-hydrolysing)